MSIELKGVYFTYPNGFTANEDLNLTIEMAEKVAIVGQNGAGKTTAVKLMNGLNQPSKGDVIIDGVNTKERTTAQIATMVGYVFQNPDDQIFNSDVTKEIEYMPRYFKMDEKEIKRRVERAVSLTGIGQYLKNNPFDIPYPIRKFVAIAAVLVVDPKYLILDEPTAGQDLRGITILTDLVKALCDEGKTVITITHDMQFVADNFPRVIAMADKHIIADGTAKDVFWNEEILAKSRIKRTEIGELANELDFDNQILFRHEMVEKLKQFI